MLIKPRKRQTAQSTFNASFSKNCLTIGLLYNGEDSSYSSHSTPNPSQIEQANELSNRLIILLFSLNFHGLSSQLSVREKSRYDALGS